VGERTVIREWEKGRKKKQREKIIPSYKHAKVYKTNETEGRPEGRSTRGFPGLRKAPDTEGTSATKNGGGSGLWVQGGAKEKRSTSFLAEHRGNKGYGCKEILR